MRTFKLTLITLLWFTSAQAQSNCCSEPACSTRARALRDAIIPLLDIVGPAIRDDPTRNRALLEAAHQKDPSSYRNFKNSMYELISFTVDNDRDICFQSLVTPEQYISINLWRTYFNDITNPVSFPSPEFCQGLGGRLEIGQGPANFLRSDMAYLGSARALLSYTFGKKRSCGNRVRILGGPAFFLLNQTPYVTFHTRLAYRLKDIMIKNPPVFLGNWNVFGEYGTNFQRFDYAGLGVEAQLGRFGVNFSVNHHFRSKHQGFLFGLVIANKKKK